jgi:tetratricopeptide (TPR) repeat protein
MSAVTTKPHTGLNPEIAKQFLLEGKVGQAIAHLKTLEAHTASDHRLLQQIAEVYVKCGQHELAGRCFARSVQLQPANPYHLYNLATSRLATGDLEEAERLFTETIRLRPDDYGAWLNRSALKKQSAERNHVRELKYVKSQLAEHDPGQIPVCYALAKELEDLARYDESFAFLQEGSVRRRRNLQYEVQEDVDALALIADTFTADLLKGGMDHSPAERPIFILGLPRSGTTLVDRIVSSHSQVDSLGEHNMLAINLMLEAGSSGQMSKAELIHQSAAIRFDNLRDRYLASIDGFGSTAPRLVDKTPLNFLYIGLIHLAMPGARIIHLRRNPMDSCYAMYKTLFRAGYPFSYSLQDVGRYYIAYRRLMDHWRTAIPGSFLDVDYENLVAHQETETRRILEYLELPWEENCLQFHRHTGPAATASAAQVRQPIYSSSVGLWRRYIRQLAPFEGKLHEHGIETRG